MKLKEIREGRNLTQKELCNLLNFKPTTYNGYEKGLAEPNLKVLTQLADFYKITLDELVGHEVPYLIDKSLLSDEEISIINEIKDLDTIQRIKVLAYIDGLKESKQKQETIIKKFEER